MNDTTKEIFEKYQVRKTRKQKNAFSSYASAIAAEYGYSFRVEKGIFGAKNLVVGDPSSAKVVYTAHYDTAPVLPFPNFITPKNIFIYILYNIAIVLGFFLVSFLIGFGVGFICSVFNVDGMIALISCEITYIALLLLLLFGPSNKHTANDNTSGVTLLIDIMRDLPEDLRDSVAFVFFDLEELGLFGSISFARKHKAQMKNRLLINFDCVGDGENIVTMADGKCRKDAKYQLFVEALKQKEAGADVKYLCRKMKFMMFPSDQMNFKKGIGVCSLKKSPIGLYVARIHTYFDTKCRKENVEYLTKAMVAFVEKL